MMIDFATSHWCKSEKENGKHCPPNNVIKCCVLSHADFLKSMLKQDGVQKPEEFDPRTAKPSLENTAPLEKTSFPFLNATDFIDYRIFEFDCNQFYPKNWNLHEVMPQIMDSTLKWNNHNGFGKAKEDEEKKITQSTTR